MGLLFSRRKTNRFGFLVSTFRIGKSRGQDFSYASCSVQVAGIFEICKRRFYSTENPTVSGRGCQCGARILSTKLVYVKDVATLNYIFLFSHPRESPLLGKFQTRRYFTSISKNSSARG